MENKRKGSTEETGVTPTHKKESDLGAGRQIGDPLNGTLSDRAGDESFDDDTIVRSEKVDTSEDTDDL